MRFLFIVMIAFSSLILTANAEDSTSPILEPVDISFMLRGYCYAGSVIEDTSAFGGFGASENYPRDISQTYETYGNATFLWLDTSTIVPFHGDHEGYRLLLVNKTDSVIEVFASDSRISIIHEAIDTAGHLQPIEYLPSSWCGNSYHTVFLGPKQQWEFVAPKYSGAFKTLIRASLIIGEDTLYSIAYNGGVNLDQFSVKQGHTATNIMDPYVD